MSTRKIISVEVTPEAKAAIDAVSESTGVDMKRIASRMYEWFARQDEITQKSILGLLPKGMEPDLARLLLERLANGETAAAPETPAAPPAPIAKIGPPSPEELAARAAKSGVRRKVAAHEPRKSPGAGKKTT